VIGNPRRRYPIRGLDQGQRGGSKTSRSPRLSEGQAPGFGDGYARRSANVRSPCGTVTPHRLGQHRAADIVRQGGARYDAMCHPRSPRPVTQGGTLGGRPSKHRRASPWFVTPRIYFAVRRAGVGNARLDLSGHSTVKKEKVGVVPLKDKGTVSGGLDRRPRFQPVPHDIADQALAEEGRRGALLVADRSQNGRAPKGRHRIRADRNQTAVNGEAGQGGMPGGNFARQPWQPSRRQFSEASKQTLLHKGQERRSFKPHGSVNWRIGGGTDKADHRHKQKGESRAAHPRRGGTDVRTKLGGRGCTRAQPGVFRTAGKDTKDGRRSSTEGRVRRVFRRRVRAGQSVWLKEGASDGRDSRGIVGPAKERRTLPVGRRTVAAKRERMPRRCAHRPTQEPAFLNASPKRRGSRRASSRYTRARDSLGGAFAAFSGP